jgi:hypothetical protein
MALLFGLLVFCVAAFTAQVTVVVKGPTIIAFFSPAKADDPDANEALADFQHYATRDRNSFATLGIEFREVYAPSFRVRVGVNATTFRVGSAGVGYYLIAPGKKPRIEYGVDNSLIATAHEYFGR